MSFEQLLIGIYFGCFTVLAVYHFLIFTGRRHDYSNLFYALYSLSISAIIAVKNFYPLSPFYNEMVRNTLFTISCYLTGSSVVLFSHYIFKVDKKSSHRYLIISFIVLTICLAAAIIAYLITADVRAIMSFFLPLSIYGLLFIIYTTYNFFKERQYRNRLKSTVILGFLVVVASCVFIAIKNALLIESSSSFFYLVMLVNALVFAYALARHFNKEHEELLLKKFQLNKLNSELDEKVKQRTAELKSALSFKSNLLTTTAHHTKTPLTLIRNGFDALFRVYPEYKRNRLLQMLRRNVDLMTRDIVNIFEMAQLEQGQELYRERRFFNLSAMLTDKIALYKKSVSLKEMTIKAEIAEGVHLKGDDLALNRVIDNLLDNCLKYCEAGTLIRVSLEELDSKVRLRVEDNGPGMSEEELSHIFERYYQIERDKKVSKGLGLGLSLTAEIIEALGGTIEVESRLGRGTTFMVSLESDAGDEEGPVESYRLSSPVEQVKVELRPAIRRRGLKTIMVVEDEPELLAYFQETFFKSYNIVTALNGREALEQLTTVRPDLIISDIMMPEVDGLAFREQLPDQLKAVPFIFITAKTKESDKLEGLALGVDDYIYKPFNIDEVRFKVARMLESGDEREQALVERVFTVLNRERGTIVDDSGRELTFEERCLHFELSEREMEVIKTLRNTSTNQEAADQLYISLSTVKKHINNILQKTGARNQKELFEQLYQ